MSAMGNMQPPDMYDMTHLMFANDSLIVERDGFVSPPKK